MKIGVLGPLMVTDDFDVPADLTLEPKQEIVLVALAANADRGVTLRELVLAVHGTTETPFHKRSIESLVSRLRASLRMKFRDADALMPPARSGLYRLSVPVEYIDAFRFMHGAEQLLNNWSAIPSEERHSLSARAISEWRGDPARTYGEAFPRALDLFRRFISTLAELGDRYCRLLLHEQRFDEARRELSRLVDLLPEHAPFRQLQQAAVSQAVEVSPTRPSFVPNKRQSAMAELRDRITASRSLPFEAVSVTAHNLDRIYLVDRVAPDHEVKIEVAWEGPGGSGANTVAALGRLGCTAAVAGVVADDAEGRILLDALESTGVNCSNVLVMPASETVRSGHSIIFSDRHGVRSIYVHPGVNESFAETLAARAGALPRLEACITKSRIVHFTSFTSPAELGLQEHLAGILSTDSLLSLNPGALYSSLGLDRLDPILSRANVLFLYEQNLQQLVQNSAAPITETSESGMHADLKRLYGWKKMKGYDQPLVTLVKRYRSSMSPENDGEYLTIACGRDAVEEIVGTQARIVLRSRQPVTDSTGAGDGMAAALHFCLLHGASLRECADVSLLLGTRVSEQVGARTGHATREELSCAWHELFSGVPAPRALDRVSR